LLAITKILIYGGFRFTTDNMKTVVTHQD